MVHNQEQARNEYAYQIENMRNMLEQFNDFLDDCYSNVGPDDVTWGNVGFLQSVSNQLGLALDMALNRED